MIRQGFPFNCQSDLDLIRSKYYQSLLKVSWQLIESCVKKQQDVLNMGHDIQGYYSLYQDLTLEDLAKATANHSRRGIFKVIKKVLKHLDDLSALEDYMTVVGRIHFTSGIDLNFFTDVGSAFCESLQYLGLHEDIWNEEVNSAWKALFRVITAMMRSGYEEDNRGTGRSLLALMDQKSVITEVWIVVQDNILRYLGNTLLLPLVMRSNKIISKYFCTYDALIENVHFVGSRHVDTLDKTKHGIWFLSCVLARTVPLLDAANLSSCEEYLKRLGRHHFIHGVRIEHLDLLGLIFAATLRAVMASQGVKGGPLFETTRVWISFIRFLTSNMKLGYKMVNNTYNTL